jgi:hypothetical protein
LTPQVQQLLCKKEEKAAMWLQEEEEYNEWMTRLHWINIHDKGLYKSEVSAKVSAKGGLQ